VLLTRRRGHWAVWLIVLAIMAQAVDVGYFVNSAYTSARRGQRVVLDQEFWRPKIADSRIVNQFPSYSCVYISGAPIANHQLLNVSLELNHWTAIEQRISNSARLARRSKDCVQETKTAAQPPAPGTLNIYLSDDNGLLITPPNPACLDTMKYFDQGGYCIGK
jgi:hypothetical protein